MTLRVGSLFSGIGGFDLAAERAGAEIVYQVEIDPWCQQILAKHWPDVPRYGDIKEIDTNELPQADLVCGGFPCQPVSVAGKQAGTGDDRWLWPEFLRIIRETRPQWFLAENVPGLLSNDNGRTFGGILRDLAGIGFDAEWESLPAAAFGAPHIRERVFMVAYPQSTRSFIVWRQQLTKDRYPRRKVGVWANQPPPMRMADGVSRRVDRLRGLGNAIVPQVAEPIIRRIIELDNEGIAS